jgi:PilZ domain
MIPAMTSVTPLAQVSDHQQRGPRFEVEQLVSVTMFGGPALLLNLGVGGIAIQAMEVLQPGCLFSLSFSLPDSNSEVQSLGKVVWSDVSGRAGLKFVAAPHLDRVRIQRWINGRRFRN